MAQSTAEAGATHAAVAKSTAEAGATEVAVNLKVAEDSLGKQVGLIDQVATAAAEKATLVVQVQTLQAGSFIHHGRVVSYDNVQTQYPLFQQPNSDSASVVTLPVGYELNVLAVAQGDSKYGSGQWYVVTVSDPNGQDILYTGFLPVEVVAQR